MLAVNGQPITDKQKMDLLEGEIRLKPGVHRFELWATGWNTSIGFGRSVKVLANLDEREILALASKATGDGIHRLATVATGIENAGTGTQGVDGLVPCPDSFFDPSTFPRGVLPQRNGPAEVVAGGEGTEFTIKFAPGSRTRLLNLIVIDQEGPVPALNKITLTDGDGGRILPVKEDFAELNKNSILEILTGDKVAVRYVDDRFVTSSLENHERILSVAYTTAKMQFEFSEVRIGRDDEPYDYYEKILRYELGKPLILTIEDADMDVSAGQDKVTVTLQSKSGGKRQFTATEDLKEPGTFRLWITPVSGVPEGESQFKVGEGEDIIAVYRDEENTDPGVPADRFASVKHARFSKPQMLLSHASASPLAQKHRPSARPLYEGFTRIDEEYVNRPAGRAPVARVSGGTVQPSWVISNVMMNAESPPSGGFEAVHGQMMYFDIIAAHLALRVGSAVNVYVQTEAGRKRAEELNGPAVEGVRRPDFDIEVPGTMRLKAQLASLDRKLDAAKSWRMTPQIAIYLSEYVKDIEKNEDRFSCSVPLIAGMLPDFGVLSEEEIDRRRRARIPFGMHGLIVQPGELIHIGFNYTKPDGTEHWLTSSAKVVTHPVLDIMEEGYRTTQTNAYVGEQLFVRVVDLGADISDRSDTVKLFMQAQSGARHFVELNEVDTHSGVFKGVVPLSYAKAGSGSSTNTTGYDVKAEGFPVVYGDVLGARYQDSNGVRTDTAIVRISKGADGFIEPFSKKYQDQETAVRTQFALAESYLELAKHHRALGQEDAALLEYETAKQMLANTIDQFRDPETRAHAEYLLGNLTQEEADATEEAELKESRYRAALSRFMNVTGTYPDTIPASKAQFKIATVYEKLNEPDIAAQEYVKLAYKYPESEFLALAMARLGTHFQRKAAEYEKQAKPLLATVDDKDAQFEGGAMEKMAVLEYLKAANIFGRLQETFPDHELAGKGGLRAGQSFMRAGENRKALKAFLKIAEYESYDGPEIRAQAMYWAGMCYENLKEAMAAYSIYKRLTYDFPESKWASYARAQLSQERLLNLETDLELKRVEEGR
jgi:TolA-binding protein